MIAPADGLRCRACGAARVEVVWSLGRTPLANALLRPGDDARLEARPPLDLAVCDACGLVQLTESVPPEQLFSEYAYFSSFSEHMQRHVEALVARLVEERRLGPTSRVLEVASNDGYLLRHYLARGVPALGIEPARNVAAAAEAAGVPTRCAFFGDDLARALAAEGEAADVIHAHNVLAHVPDLTGFVAGLARLLAPDGVAVIEVPYVRDLVDQCEFDTIYHEHLCYFALGPLVRLFARGGLVVRDVERVAIHGGSLRLRVARGGAPGPAVVALLAEEERLGLWRPASYRGFGQRAEGLLAELRALLAELRGRGARLAVYGASAKGSTLLNLLGCAPGTFEFVADRSTVKQGRRTPGTHLPIVSPAALLERAPTHVLLLVWNFADEVLEQQAEFRRRGGRFIIPIPTPRVV